MRLGLDLPGGADLRAGAAVVQQRLLLHVPARRRFDALRAELDYIREGQNAEHFAAAFADDPDVQIPRVFWGTTTSQIITLERLRGMKVTDLAALEAAGIDRHDLARRATRAVAKMVYDDGFFHADPHPGNFFIQNGGGIGIIDFGMVGTLNDRLRGQLTRLIIAVVREDPDLMVSSLVELGAARVRVDRAGLRQEMAHLLARYARQPLGTVRFETAIGEIFEVIRRYGLRVPRDLAVLVRALVMAESLATELYPAFDLVEELTPYATRQLMAELSPAALRRRLERTGIDLAALAVDLPRQLHRALDVLGDGRLEFHLRTEELEPLLVRSERLGNRIAASVLAAALINTAAVLVVSRRRRPGSPHRRRRSRRAGGR